MKAILTIALMAVLMMAAFAAPMAAAQESDDSSDAIALYNDTSNITDGMVIAPAPGSTSDTSIETEAELGLNESVSSGKIAWKQIGLWFIFNQEKKIQAELQLAKLRLIQAKIAAKNNNSDAMEKALEAHERIINRVKERISKLDGASDAAGLNASASRLVGLERAIQVHERRLEFLSNILAIANLSESQKQKIEAKIANTQEVTNKLQELSDSKKEQIKTKLMAVRNLTEEEAEEIVEQKVSSVQEKIQQRLEKREEIRQEIRDKINSEAG